MKVYEEQSDGQIADREAIPTRHPVYECDTQTVKEIPNKTLCF